tara:strand:+ start:2085 stop:2588 length:504 start_codon:yes stop_codon:yes gene_type:complete
MKIVVVSGYFNPIHVGHLDYIEEASKLGDSLIVIINNDEQVKIKGSKPFMNENDRARIVAAIGCVSRCVISNDTDGTVVETLKELYNSYSVDWDFDDMIFANGGDRKKDNSPEEEYCRWRGIKTVYNVGGKKTQSSSELLRYTTSPPSLSVGDTVIGQRKKNKKEML